LKARFRTWLVGRGVAGLDETGRLLNVGDADESSLRAARSWTSASHPLRSGEGQDVVVNSAPSRRRCPEVRSEGDVGAGAEAAGGHWALAPRRQLLPRPGCRSD